MNDAQADHIPDVDKKAPSGAHIYKFLKVISALDGDTIVTPDILSDLIALAARLEEIDREARGGPPKSL